jgi:ABC-type Fe3+ transport system permease subunit
MRTRIIAVMELVLISPATLFMIALALRHLQPLQYEPAHSAQQLVTWYAVRMWTLWVLLFGLPLIALVVGCSELMRNWNRDTVVPLKSQKSLVMARPNLTSLIATTTLISGVILVIVVLHVLAN